MESLCIKGPWSYSKIVAFRSLRDEITCKAVSLYYLKHFIFVIFSLKVYIMWHRRKCCVEKGKGTVRGGKVAK